MTIELSNEPRGCGKIQEGAVYMGAPLGVGPLAKWAWVVGKLWDSDEDESIRYSPDILPNRQQVEIDWAGTKAAGRLTDEPVEKDDGPLFAVADHIGSCYYSPWSFYLETISRGPNRRVRRDMAKLWARNVPFPILFGSKDVPWFDSQEHAERFLFWAVKEGLIPLSKFHPPGDAGSTLKIFIASCDWTPTWTGKYFLSSSGNNGAGHPAMLVIKALEQAGWEELEIPPAAYPSSFQRVIFGASWVTRICQVLDDKDDLDSDLAEAGVLKAIVKEVTK